MNRSLFLVVAFSTLLSAVACTETRPVTRDQPRACFKVFFNNDELTDGKTVCDAVFPVPRCVPFSADPASAALRSLFSGPEAGERALGYRSFFSNSTADLLDRVQIVERTAYVDLRDPRAILPNATSSCGSAEFLTQIRRTLEQFPVFDRIIFAIDGQPELFYDWMEMECDHSNDNCDPVPAD